MTLHLISQTSADIVGDNHVSLEKPLVICVTEIQVFLDSHLGYFNLTGYTLLPLRFARIGATVYIKEDITRLYWYSSSARTRNQI